MSRLAAVSICLKQTLEGCLPKALIASPPWGKTSFLQLNSRLPIASVFWGDWSLDTLPVRLTAMGTVALRWLLPCTLLDIHGYPAKEGCANTLPRSPLQCLEARWGS